MPFPISLNFSSNKNAISAYCRRFGPRLRCRSPSKLHVARLTVRKLADAAGCAAGGVMTRSYLRFAFASTLLPLFLLTMAGLSHAATITVTSLLDTGSGTLRDAINTANGTPAAVDTINFSVSGTITLGSPLPAVANTSGALTIDGSGQTITISGANAVQIFAILSI